MKLFIILSSFLFAGIAYAEQNEQFEEASNIIRSLDNSLNQNIQAVNDYYKQFEFRAPFGGRPLRPHRPYRPLASSAYRPPAYVPPPAYAPAPAYAPPPAAPAYAPPPAYAPAPVAPAPVAPTYVPSSSLSKPVIVIPPVSKPYPGKCDSLGFLKARAIQLESMISPATKRACFLENKMDGKETRAAEHDNILPEVTDPTMLALIDPQARVELKQNKRDLCANPRIFFRTISFIKRLFRFLFSSHVCPPINLITNYLLKKFELGTSVSDSISSQYADQ